MSSRTLLLTAAALCVLSSSTRVSVAATTGTLEPGQAEARTTLTRAVDVPSTWTYPRHEARSIWITGTELLESRESVSDKLTGIAEANFNAVMLDTWLRGYVIYPDSKIVPQLPAAKASGGDKLAEAIEAAHALGLRVDAWPEYGFYAYYTKDAQKDKSRGPLLDKYPHLTALRADGSAALHNPTLGDFYSLCPANPESHQLLGSILAETVKRYPFDGVNLDRLRFPSAEYCHCVWCKVNFERDSGYALKAFPPDSREQAEFLQWKREQNARAVQTITTMIRAARPKAELQGDASDSPTGSVAKVPTERPESFPITAYVVGPDEMDDKAQSWDLWVKRGLVDAVAVSMYGPDIRPTISRALQLLEGNSSSLLCAISCDLPHTSYYLRNISFARERVPLGQFTWYAGKVQDDLAGLKSGPYKKPGQWPVFGNTDQGR